VVVVAVLGAYSVWAPSTVSNGAGSPTPTHAPTQQPGTQASTSTLIASGGAPTSAAVGPSGPRAVVDRTLLAVLPTTIGGNALSEDPDAEQTAIADPDLGANVDRIVTAFVGDPAGENWAYTAVADVRPVARTDAFYQDWQATFDQSACDQAGGVTAHATLQIAGREVDQSTCAGGVRTYHVRMKSGALMVSISDLGPAKYGEQVLQALRP
jgi:hypothetical protein